MQSTAAAMTPPRQIGIIGLGLMGTAFAERLIAAGRAVTGFDVDADRCVAFEAHGRVTCSIEDMVQRSDPIIISVFDTGQVEEVVDGGLLPACGTGTERIVVCTSTCDPDRIAALAQRVEGRGLRFLEMPISGTSEQVRQGQAVGLMGGDPAVAEDVAGVLDAIVGTRLHVGAAGNGGRTKLAVNLILGLNRLALAEGLIFAERLGLDPEAFLHVARQCASYSQVMDTKGPKMVRGEFSPEGRVRQTLKDVRLMLEQAERLGQQLPLATLSAELLAACQRNGEGDLDNSAVMLEIRRRTG